MRAARRASSEGAASMRRMSWISGAALRPADHTNEPRSVPGWDGSISMARVTTEFLASRVAGFPAGVGVVPVKPSSR